MRTLQPRTSAWHYCVYMVYYTTMVHTMMCVKVCRQERAYGYENTMVYALRTNASIQLIGLRVVTPINMWGPLASAQYKQKTYVYTTSILVKCGLRERVQSAFMLAVRAFLFAFAGEGPINLCALAYSSMVQGLFSYSNRSACTRTASISCIIQCCCRWITISWSRNRCTCNVINLREKVRRNVK